MASELPLDIWVVITSFLPFNDQLKTRCLCKNIKDNVINTTPIIKKIELLSKEIKIFLQLPNQLTTLDYYLEDVAKFHYSIFIMINDCIEINLLFDLLKIDKMLRWNKKSFTQKDRKIMNDNNNNKYYKIGSRIHDHYDKTNSCYHKFNQKLNLVFNDKQWFLVVRKILIFEKFITITKEMTEEILDAIEFGKNINSNYDTIKMEISNCKRVYFGQEDRIR